jgi:putative ABC transport system permease protein
MDKSTHTADFRASRTGPVESVMQDVRYALRTLRCSPSFTFVAVLILALGIGANTAIFSVISAVLLRPLPFPDPERLVVLWEDRSAAGGYAQGMPAWADYDEWQRRSRSFDGMAAIADVSYNLTGGGEPERLEASDTTANLFSLLGAQALLGRTFTAEDEGPAALPVVVIDERLWLRRFGGDPGVIGQSIVLDGLSYTVIGVVASDFRFPDDNAIWVPASPQELARQGGVFVVAKLAAGTAASEAEAEMSTLATTLDQERGISPNGVRIAVAGLHDYFAREARPTLFMLLGAVAIVLLITCANVANLLLARGSMRSRELALRQALGAAHGRLLRQLLTESAVLAVAGVLVGIALATASFGFLARLVPNGLPEGTSAALDWRVLVFTIGLTLATVVLFGAGPALAAARIDLAHGLKKRGRGASPHRAKVRDALVVAEITLTVVLLAAGGLLLRSYGAVLAVDPGFSPQNLLVAQTFPSTTRYEDAAKRGAFYRGVLERVRALPGVTGAGYVNYPPLTLQGGLTRITPEGGVDSAPNEELRYLANFRAVSAGYLSTLGAPLIDGTHFEERGDAEEGGQRAVIVNESLARRLLPNRNPIGARLKLGDARSTEPWFTIIGVVGDIRQTALDSPPEPEMYFSFEQPPSNAPFLWPRHLVVRTEGDPLAVAGAVRNTIWQVDPDQSISWLRPMTEIVDADLASRNTQLTLVGVFAAVALLLASVGLYGVLSYAVAQRTPEIGVRMALGAPRASVVRSVVRRALLLAVIGLGLGLAGAFGVTRFIASFLFEVSPTDVATLAGVAAVVLIVTGCASYVPARRAAAVDPVLVLRTD